jgi:hypothetical protein
MGQNILLLNTKVDMENTRGTAKTITAITKATEALITCTHDFAIGDYVFLEGVVGMPEINGRLVRVKSVSTTVSFVAEGLDSTLFSTYASGGSAYKIASWHAFDNLTSLNYPEPTPNPIDVTTIHNNQKFEVFGLDDAPTITLNTISDPTSVTTKAVRVASTKKSITAFRVTLQTGTILIFTGYVAGGRGLDGSVGALATGQMSIKLAAPEQYL